MFFQSPFVLHPLMFVYFCCRFQFAYAPKAPKTDKTKLLIYLFITILYLEIFSTNITFFYVFTVFFFYTPDWLKIDFSVNVWQIFVIAIHACHYAYAQTTRSNVMPYLFWRVQRNLILNNQCQESMFWL